MKNVWIVDNHLLFDKSVHAVIIEYFTPVFMKKFKNTNEILSSIKNFSITDNDLFIIGLSSYEKESVFKLAEYVRFQNNYCFIIFIAEDTRYCLEALQKNILLFNYIPKKGFSKAEFEKVLHDTLVEVRIHEQFRKFEKLFITIKLSKGSHYFNLPISDIMYIESVPGDKGSVRFNCKQNEILVNYKLIDIKNKLKNTSDFFLLKSYVLNLLHIRKIDGRNSFIEFSNLGRLYVGKKF